MGVVNYVLAKDDITTIADHVTSADPHAMHIPNGSVAALIARLRDAEAARDAALAEAERLDFLLKEWRR